MGIKDNNPGNIKKTNDKWDGLVPSKGKYFAFESPEYGVRAMTRLLRTYDIKHGLNTIKGIISRYAPRSENDTDTYIKNVSSFTGYDPNQELNLEDRAVMKNLIKAIIRQENKGKDLFSDKFYNDVFQMEGLDFFEDEALGDPFDVKDSRDERFPDLVDNDIASRSRSSLDNQSKELFEESSELGDSEADEYAINRPELPLGKPVDPLSDELVGSEIYSKSVGDPMDDETDAYYMANKGVFSPSLQRGSEADIDTGPEAEPISLPEGYEEQGIFEYLFGDNADIDYDYEFEPDTLNLKEGGEVEADFVKTKDEQEEEQEEDDNDPADPPPGATPKEVADDIPAMLSEGEYVLPANVVKYIGLERIINMHRQVLCEIQEMEDLGLIQNVDENGKPEDDDEEMKFAKKPTEGVVEIVVASSPKSSSLMSKEPLNFFEGGQPTDADAAAAAGVGADTAGTGMSGPEGNVPDDVAGNPTGVAGPDASLSSGLNVSGLTAVEVAIADMAEKQGADNPIGTARAATSMGYTGVNEFSTEKSIDEQVDEAVDARVANNPTSKQLDINAKLEKGFQQANPGVTQGVGAAASLMGAIPGLGLVSTVGNVVNAAKGEKTTAELAGLNEVFSGILDNIPSVDIDVPDVVTDIVDKVGEFADKVPGNPNETTEEPSGQKSEDPEKIEDQIEVAGEVEPTVTLDDEIFIPGVGLVKNAPRQGIMSLT